MHDALTVQAALRDELLSETSGPTPRMTVGAYAKSWVEHLASNKRVRIDTTLRNIVETLDLHILPELGDIYYDCLTVTDVKRWQTAMGRKRKKNDEPYSTTSINNWLRVLRMMGSEASRELDLPRNVASIVRMLPDEEKAKVVLKEDELIKVLVAVRQHYPQHFAMVVALGATGLRFGELSALHWTDLDEDEGLIRVERRQVRGTIDLPKTKKKRSVAVEPWVFDVLREHRRELLRVQRPGLDKGLVFPSTTGGYRQPAVLDKPMQRISTITGIKKKVTAQVMRRTFNNLLRQRGIDEMVLRAMTGHATKEMTEHYSEVTAEEKRRAVERGLGNVFELVREKTGSQTGCGGSADAPGPSQRTATGEDA